MTKALILAATMLGVLAINIAFARMGEPRSEWLVCEALNINVCGGDA